MHWSCVGNFPATAVGPTNSSNSHTRLDKVIGSPFFRAHLSNPPFRPSSSSARFGNSGIFASISSHFFRLSSSFAHRLTDVQHHHHHHHPKVQGKKTPIEPPNVRKKATNRQNSNTTNNNKERNKKEKTGLPSENAKRDTELRMR